MSALGTAQLARLADLAELAGSSSSGPSRSLVIGTAGAALILCLVLPVFRHGLTMAHEGGHAATALAFGASVESVTLNRDQSGLTVVRGLGRFALIFFWLTGYLGPSIFGLLGAVLLAGGTVQGVLFVTLVLLVLLLIATSGTFGRILVLFTGVVFFLAARYGSSGVQTFLAFTWVWFLLIGACVDVLLAFGLHNEARAAGSKGAGDPVFLRNHTYVPAVFWLLLFFLGSVAGLVIGGTILLSS
jgi:hypothetical protein